MAIICGRYWLEANTKKTTILQKEFLKIFSDSPEGFLEEIRQEIPSLILIPQSDMDQIIAWDDLIQNRGEKHGDRELFKYFPGTEKIPLLLSNHRSTGKVESSIKKFLERLVKESPRFNEHNMFVMALDDDLFFEILEKNKVSWAAEVRAQEQKYDSAGHNPPSRGTNGDNSENKRTRNENMLKSVFFGNSPPIHRVRNQLLQAGEHDQIMLLLGETGTGKSRAARAIHEVSSLSQHPFVTFACGAVIGTLFESELFGHVKGAFYGADSDRKGLWRQAGEGTLFFDEIGDLPLDQQLKLLDAFERNVVRPVGSDKEMPVKARLIFATNQDLDAMVRRKVFREDLYWRIRHITIEMPPLQVQKDSIPYIAQELWKKIGNKKDYHALPHEILQHLQQMDWPGNVRSLIAVLKCLHYQNFKKHPKDIHDLYDASASIHLSLKKQSSESEPTANGNEVDLHRVRCLQHLKKAEEWVRACQKVFEPYAPGNSKVEQLEKLDPLLISNRIEQVKNLTSEPFHFYKEESFMLINNLQGKLAYFSELLEKKLWDQANYYLSKEILENFRKAQTVLFASVEALLR